MPPIKFKNSEDYEEHCEQLVQVGIDTAAKRIWERVSDEMSVYWEHERLYHMEFGGAYLSKACNRLTRTQAERLDAYKCALAAIGCRLDVVTDEIGYTRIHEVGLSQDGGGLGCVRSFPRDEWL